MPRQRDPVERAADGDRDLYDVATWEARTVLDRWSVRVYRGLKWSLRALVVLTALGILLAQVALSSLGMVVDDPVLVVLIVLSVAPAAGLAAYIWWADVTTGEPLRLIAATFVLGVLFAMFAALVNAAGQPIFAAIPVLGLPLFFYLVVGPAEELAKWFAVRLYAFRDAAFDSVLDGAVYGAVAGLGFATIENALYITQGLTSVSDPAAIIGAAGGTAAVRSLAGPGHVLYSALAGYYLGLAKFNPDRAGPIVVKGLLIAAFVHGTYNVLVGIVPPLLSAGLFWLTEPAAFVVFIVVYDGFLGYVLYRKLDRYRTAFHESQARLDQDASALEAEVTEFERGLPAVDPAESGADDPVARDGGRAADGGDGSSAGDGGRALDGGDGSPADEEDGSPAGDGE